MRYSAGALSFCLRRKALQPREPVADGVRVIVGTSDPAFLLRNVFLRTLGRGHVDPAGPGDGDTDMRALAGLSFWRWLLVSGERTTVRRVGASPHVSPPRSGLGCSGN